MAGVHGVGPWRVVLKIDRREPALRGTQELILILEVVLWRLVDDEVQVQIPHLLGGDLAHVSGQVERGPAPAVALWSTRLDGQVPVVVDAGQRIEVAAVDVPDQDLQAPHAATPITSKLSAAAITASGSTHCRQRWSIGQTA